ncbi:MAG: periplasmic heavy metal sensor [Saprospiraceae bacterium]|nr:periplasmic heavy metal sensor [Saprospiraceae bacterium]
MQTLTFYKIAVVTLLLLNVGTLTFLWVNRPPNPREAGPFQFLVRATGMDEAQQEVYDQLRMEHRATLETYRNQNKQVREAMFRLMATKEADAPEVQMLADSLGALRAKEERFTYEHFRQVRALCRPDQLQRFDAAIEEAMQSMGPPDRRQRGR